MNVHKTHNNSIMNIHQLNDYIESNNLSYFLPSKKNNNIVKFILSNSYSYFNYLPMDIKKIIIDLLQLPPSDFFTSVYNDVFTRNYIRFISSNRFHLFILRTFRDISFSYVLKVI